MNLSNDEPAFPIQDCSKNQCYGMTLRDYFAAKAMQSPAMPVGLGPADRARWCYAESDAMLKERTK